MQVRCMSVLVVCAAHEYYFSTEVVCTYVARGTTLCSKTFAAHTARKSKVSHLFVCIYSSSSSSSSIAVYCEHMHTTASLPVTLLKLTNCSWKLTELVCTNIACSAAAAAAAATASTVVELLDMSILTASCTGESQAAAIERTAQCQRCAATKCHPSDDQIALLGTVVALARLIMSISSLV
eukprot:4791-Heterococcus_DN1.PRE.2